MLEQKLNSEQKDETQLPSSPNNAKPNVVRSPNYVSAGNEETIQGYLPVHGRYDTTELDKELDELVSYFTNKVNAIRSKYFVDGRGLKVMPNLRPHEGGSAILFTIDLSELRDNNVTLS